MNDAPCKLSSLLLALLLLGLSGCGAEKPAMQPAPVIQPPAVPAAPAPRPATPAPTVTTPTPPPPPAAPPPAVPDVPPVSPPPPSPSQPMAQKPAAPAPPAPVTAALGKAKVSRADDLFEKPFTDARVIKRLPAGEEVDLLQRQGAWYQLRTGGQQGWMRMLSVRSTAPAAVASSGSLTQVATGRAGTGQIVSTTGVRGLGEEQLQEAPFSEAAIAAAERYRITPAEAGRLARAQGLAPRQVPALPAATTGGAP